LRSFFSVFGYFFGCFAAASVGDRLITGKIVFDIFVILYYLIVMPVVELVVRCFSAVFSLLVIRRTEYRVYVSSY
jgi:hypothetical protein